MEFSRQEYWSREPCPSPGDLPDPGIEPVSPALQANSLPSEQPGKPKGWYGCTEEVGRWQVERKKTSLTRKKTWAASVRALNPNHRPPGSIVVTYCFKQQVLRAFLGNPLCSTADNDKQSHATGNEAQCFSS